MNEIICPNCKKAFKVDEAGFTDILKQVRDHQFEEELTNRLDSAVKIAEATLKNSLQEELTKKDNQLHELKAKNNLELIEMKSKIDHAATQNKLEISEAIKNIEKERDALLNTLKIKDTEKQSAIKLAEATIKESLQEELAKKDTEIANIKSKIKSIEIENKLELSEAIKQIEQDRDNLANDLKMKDTETELLKVSIKEQYTSKLVLKDETIKMKDDEIDRLKDFKQKLSTKMVGESLEQHCEIEFNKLRATAFQNAYFEKDNDSRAGNKGDYIYKENDEAGNEIKI